MNKRIKKLWVRDLLSGKFKQGKGELNKNDTHLCCLGVLCELAVKEGIIVKNPLPTYSKSFTYGRNKEEAILPSKVAKWAGLRDRSPSINNNTLVSYNDGGYKNKDGIKVKKSLSFKKIAKLIEENL